MFYDGSHSANLKLLKIDILIDACITKVREVMKSRNFLGPLRKCTLFLFVTVSFDVSHDSENALQGGD